MNSKQALAATVELFGSAALIEDGKKASPSLKRYRVGKLNNIGPMGVFSIKGHGDTWAEAIEDARRAVYEASMVFDLSPPEA